MESINFIIQVTGMKHPDDMKIVEWSFKNVFTKMRF